MNNINKILLVTSVLLFFATIIISQGNMKNVIDPTNSIYDKSLIGALNNLSNLIPANETIVTSDNSPYLVYFTRHYSTAPWVVEYEEDTFDININTIAIVGGLTISSNPPGARIFIDGIPQDPYVTPMTLNNIRPGNHIIKLSLPGYQEVIKYIDIGRQEANISMPKDDPKEILVNYMRKNNYSYLVVFEGRSQIKGFDELFSSEGLYRLDSNFMEIANYKTDFSKIHLYRMKGLK